MLNQATWMLFSLQNVSLNTDNYQKTNPFPTTAHLILHCFRPHHLEIFLVSLICSLTQDSALSLSHSSHSSREVLVGTLFFSTHLTADFERANVYTQHTFFMLWKNNNECKRPIKNVHTRKSSLLFSYLWITHNWLKSS